MDSFISEISERFYNAAEAINKENEPEIKQLIVKSVLCVAGCYQTPDPLSQCEDCANKCNLLLKESQDEIDKHINYMQNTLQNCMQGCELKKNKLDIQDFKTCISSCSNDAEKLLADIRKEAKDIIRKYLD